MTQKPQGFGSAILNFGFEAAHRQPEVGGKCVNLHGHSWDVNVTLYNNSVVGGVNEQTGLSVEFSTVKDAIKAFIDTYFDHATLLGQADPLTPILQSLGLKVFTFGEDGDYEPLPWPSVEAVAFCLGKYLQDYIKDYVGTYVTIEAVTVSETSTNTFAWTSPQSLSDRSAAISQDGQVGGEPCG